MSSPRKPICYIIAGPNGVGKTTFAMRYLPAIAQCRNFVNADEIAKGLAPLDAQGSVMQAGKLFFSQLEEKLADRQDFAFETTLSGRNYLTKIPAWQAAGWKVMLFFLYVPTAEVSALRVHQRVMQGGHDIPLEDIARRFPRCLHNLFLYKEVCDETLCFDNSQATPVVVFHQSETKCLKIFDSSQWAFIREFA